MIKQYDDKHRVILAIDPGVNNTGWALLKYEGDLVHIEDMGFIERPKLKCATKTHVTVDFAKQVGSDLSGQLRCVDATVMEFNDIFGHLGSAVKMAYLDGFLSARTEGDTVLVRPSEWKRGGKKKATSHGYWFKYLDKNSIDKVDGLCYNLTKVKAEHVLDAVSIGIYYLMTEEK